MVNEKKKDQCSTLREYPRTKGSATPSSCSPPKNKHANGSIADIAESRQLTTPGKN